MTSLRTYSPPRAAPTSTTIRRLAAGGIMSVSAPPEVMLKALREMQDELDHADLTIYTLKETINILSKNLRDAEEALEHRHYEFEQLHLKLQALTFVEYYVEPEEDKEAKKKSPQHGIISNQGPPKPKGEQTATTTTTTSEKNTKNSGPPTARRKSSNSKKKEQDGTLSDSKNYHHHGSGNPKIKRSKSSSDVTDQNTEVGNDNSGKPRLKRSNSSKMVSSSSLSSNCSNNSDSSSNKQKKDKHSQSINATDSTVKVKKKKVHGGGGGGGKKSSSQAPSASFEKLYQQQVNDLKQQEELKHLLQRARQESDGTSSSFRDPINHNTPAAASSKDGPPAPLATPKTDAREYLQQPKQQQKLGNVTYSSKNDEKDEDKMLQVMSCDDEEWATDDDETMNHLTPGTSVTCPMLDNDRRRPVVSLKKLTETASLLDEDDEDEDENSGDDDNNNSNENADNSTRFCVPQTPAPPMMLGIKQLSDDDEDDGDDVDIKQPTQSYGNHFANDKERAMHTPLPPDGNDMGDFMGLTSSLGCVSLKYNNSKADDDDDGLVSPSIIAEGAMEVISASSFVEEEESSPEKKRDTNLAAPQNIQPKQQQQQMQQPPPPPPPPPLKQKAQKSELEPEGPRQAAFVKVLLQRDHAELQAKQYESELRRAQKRIQDLSNQLEHINKRKTATKKKRSKSTTCSSNSPKRVSSSSPEQKAEGSDDFDPTDADLAAGIRRIPRPALLVMQPGEQVSL